MDFISIGYACQTAHQIRRYTKKNDAFFFDWLTSPGQSYKALFLDENGHFNKDNCAALPKIDFSVFRGKTVNYGKVHVVDSYSGLNYQHEFEVIGKSAIIDESKIESHLPVAKSKFIYLRNKTINAIKNSDEPVLVRYENVKTKNEAIDLAKDIYQTFYHLNNKLKVVITSCLIDDDYTAGDNIYIFKINAAELWTGDDKSWDRVFSTVTSSGAGVITYNNYDFWKEKIHKDKNIAEFTLGCTMDGIHSLQLSKIPLDILVKNMAQIYSNEYIMVTFSAAMARKDNFAPFFALSGVAAKLNLPLIAFSDPTMSLSAGLTLGWYAGNKFYPKLPNDIAKICDEIIEVTGKKLLFVGGSGGGFASMNIQSLMQHKLETKLIVWNPQTDLLAYSRMAVSYYMKVAYADNDNVVNLSNLKQFTDERVKNTLKHSPELNRIILMDGYDYKHIRDLKVFFGDLDHAKCNKNLIVADNTVVCFGDWGRFGDGHLQPPVNVLTEIISGVANGNQHEEIDALVNKTNTTQRKLVSIRDKGSSFTNVKISGSFFGDFLEIETNLPELFFGYDLSIRLVEKDSRKVIYWGKRQDYTIKSREFIQLKNTKITQANLNKYDIHLSIKDFFNKEVILVKELNYANTKVFGLGEV